ncbi:NUC188 domain-containing protein [Chytriomyces cf. hyalinus JEL632]|nr:NUC188 domain-containing protein [Chytriomyces cf. hyalinus JEL632]
MNVKKEHSGKDAKPQFANAKQRRTARQVIDVQPVKDPESIARTICVEEFIDARKFEINSMETALKNATEFTGNMRVFQTLPRHMRRRAASYNVKRLPQRFRQRALDQVANHGEKPQPMKKSRKAKRKPGAIFEMFQKRSKENKRWLDTHLWHAKRMHMDHLWGYMVALHRNDKSTKSNFRASQHTCIVHDASYTTCLEIKGNLSDIGAVMGRVSDPTFMSVGAKRYAGGDKQGSIFIHRAGEYPAGSIALVSFFWIPSEQQDEERMLWVWVHPSAAPDVFAAISEAITASAAPVSINNLQSQMTRFELTGPRSHALLQEILKPDASCDITRAGRNLWSSLKTLRSPTSIPAGVILGMSVMDPRLSFPPKIQQRDAEIQASHATQQSLNDSLVRWPANVSKSTLHDPSVRQVFLRSKPTDAELIAKLQKKKNQPASSIIEDAALEPPTVPILLIQRNTHNASLGDKNANEFLNGWDVVLPAGTVAVNLWKSIIFAGAHATGIYDRRRLCFETGVASFPHDYPETAAHVQWATQQMTSKKETWERKPVAKRCNYAKLKVLDPFASHFARLVGSQFQSDSEVELKPVDVVHSVKLVAIIQDFLRKQEATDLQVLTALCRDAIQTARPGFSMNHPFSLKDAFVRCRLTMMGRGLPDEHGIVYRASPDGIAYWTQYFNRRMKNKSIDGEDDDEFDWSKPPSIENDAEIAQVLDKFPPHDMMIGHVTNGGFSMANGQGVAIACCLIRGLLQAKEGSIVGSLGDAMATGKPMKMFVLVRGPRGRICRPASLELLV